MFTLEKEIVLYEFQYIERFDGGAWQMCKVSFRWNGKRRGRKTMR